MEQETKQCQNCKQNFTIEPEDFVFYEKMKVPSSAQGSGMAMPAPTFCPECRMKRRMVWRNERTLYKRKCEKCGENIIAIYNEQSPYKTYCHKCWWSDEWNAIDYGKEFDFSLSFFENFSRLLKEVPQNNLIAENNTNSDYVNFQTNSKNCYLASGGASNENTMYSNHGNYSKDSSDLYYFTKAELCYEDVICQNSYKLFFSQNCNNCSNSYFLYDCKNLQNCFGCVGLRNKQYYIFNKPHTKEEYENKLNEFNCGSFNNLIKQKELFKNFKLAFPYKFINSLKTINVSGDNVFDARDCNMAFDVLPGGSENSKFVFWAGADMKDTYDGTGVGVKGELLYEGVSVALLNARVFFSVAIRNSHDIYYSFNCHGSSNLFGCIGLRNKQYCILNKQYTKEEYEELVPRIIKHMEEIPYIDKKGRIYKYGEFFPSELSPFAYNETIAQEYFPLTKEQAIEQGYSWKDPEERNIQITMTTDQIPDHIKDVPNSIVNEIIQCAHAVSQISADDTQINTDNQSKSASNQLKSACNEQCTTAFKIIPQELEFYRKMNLPLPRLCPNCRHYQRIKQRNPLKLWKRKCQCQNNQRPTTNDQQQYKNTTQHFHGENPCPNEFETTYSPERPEIVYCEQCYNAEVA